jgi:hypothetical protein
VSKPNGAIVVVIAMPLAFDSTSHGTFAFGFFNIRSDMLLLDNRFFFATDFCAWIARIAAADESAGAPALDGWIIDRREDVGDLHGAIQGRRLTGFIGATYRRYPFPAAPEEFRQAPEGGATQAEIAEMIGRFGRRASFRLAADRAADRVSFDGVEVTGAVLRDLLRYVWRGGYPRWRDELRPAYVVAMKEALAGCAAWPFAGIDWDG